MTILERIKLNSAKHPERVVMRTQYGFGEMTMKWGELDAFSDKLAYYLTKELRTNKPIIVYGHKHPMILVCFLACVKSGRAYCPIDVNVPLSRTEAIIREVEPEIILTTEPLEIDSDRIKELQEINEIISTTDGKADSSNYVTAEDVFYIIFTSGSTGTPKGVQITRDCLDNFIKWALCLGSGTAQEKVYTFMNQAPFSFDLSVMDLYLCLYTGGTLFALGKNVQVDMKLLYRGLTRPAISCRPLLRLMPCAATPRRGIPTPVISRPTMAGHTLRPAWLPRKMGKIRFPAPKNRPNSMVAMKNCWLKVSRLLCVFIIHSPNLIACQYNTIFGGRQEKSQTFVPDKRTNR